MIGCVCKYTHVSFLPFTLLTKRIPVFFGKFSTSNGSKIINKYLFYEKNLNKLTIALSYQPKYVFLPKSTYK